MKRSKETTIDVNGTAVEWDLRASDGMFFARYNGEQFEADSLKKLTDKLRAKAKAKPLNIPYVKFDVDWTVDTSGNDGEALVITRGKVLSIHSGNGNFILADDNDGQSYQHGRGGLLNGNTDVDKLRALWIAKQAAESAWQEFVNANELEIPKGDEQ